MSFSNFKFTTFKEKALNILSIITILCCGCVLLSLFASLHWILDLFRHFTVKYFFILTSLSLIFLIERKWVYGFTAALFSLICFYPIAPYYTSKKLTQP